MITRPSSDTTVHRVRERTIADRRVFRVRQHIQHRRIVERHTHRRELLGKRSPKSPRQVRAAGATQRQHGRPFGERPLQPRDTATLLIDRHPGRELSAERLDLPGHFPDLIGILDVPLEQDHAANGELARERLELDRNLGTIEARDEQLADLLAECEWGHVMSARGAATSHYSGACEAQAQRPRVPRGRMHAGVRTGPAGRLRIMQPCRTPSGAGARTVDNLAIARLLGEIADLLEIKAENPFKIRAYRNASDSVAARRRAPGRPR